ncbi:MAG: hypothetical protein IJD04_07615 [Desulfovibrionaceae bacterium]|nr:hypothetical protein [Desulfovibrionaceae bacterium]
MNFSRKIICACLIGIIAAALTACDSPSRRASVDLSRSAVLYKLEEVDRSTPEVYVYPTTPSPYPPNALMLPFPVTQRLGPQEAEPISKGICRILWQAMVKEEAFPVLEYDESVYIYTLNQALALAYAKGADMLITGNIPYLITGGSTGMNQLVVHMEVHDVQTGELIWSITSSGALDAKPSQDYIFFQRKSKLPHDALYAVAMALGSDMGKVLYDWANAVDEDNSRSPELDGGPKGWREPPAF